MMQIIKYPDSNAWAEILKRPTSNYDTVRAQVADILLDVKKNGDKALKNYAEKFDNVKLSSLTVSTEEWEAADTIAPALKQAIRNAIQNIRTFHAAQTEQPVKVETQPGIECWRKSVAIEKVGLYIPGGTAPLFSTLLMLAIPALLAGCKDIVVCTPTDEKGNIPATILFVAQELGLRQLYKAGGAQAIASMAYGTETIPQVYKIFGPGNSYVTCSKMMVAAEGMAIDIPAGPSEVAILADESCSPEYVAADLLSQAEHGVDSQVVLVSDNIDVINEVNACLTVQLNALPRKSIVQKALENSKAILVSSLDEGMQILNEYAPEHLIISCRDSEAVAKQVINAGSVFLGKYSPESAGDYASGTNHTLPTNGFAKAYSGVSLDSFVKKITFQKLSQSGLQAIADAVKEMAMAEGLYAHANAITIRQKKHMKQFDLNKIVRPNIQRLVPYSSARSEYNGNATIFLDANENSITIGSNAYNRYPDPLQKELKQRISELKDIAPANIFIGNGSDEPIDLLIRMCCVPGADSILICPPTYGMYEVAAQINDVAVQRVLLTANYQLDVPEVLKQVTENTKLIFICTPNNPTGNVMNEVDIAAVLDNFSGIVVVDEAYIDFAEGNSLALKLDRYPNLVILQTLSKAWGLAALRVGLAFASEEIISILNKIKAPYNINKASQQLVFQVLSDTEQTANAVNTLLQQRKQLAAALKKITGVLNVYPSDANFLLVKFENAEDVYKYLLSKKIVVRNRSNQPLCENCLRITVGSFAENEFLITALKEYQL